MTTTSTVLRAGLSCLLSLSPSSGSPATFLFISQLLGQVSLALGKKIILMVAASDRRVLSPTGFLVLYH